MVIDTSATACTPPSNSFVRPSMTRSPPPDGASRSRSATEARSEQALADDEGDEGDDELHSGERGDRPGVALPPELDHRRADHFRTAGDEEQRARVLLQEADEEEDERGRERRPQERDEDLAHRAQPRRAGDAARPVELARDAQDRRQDRAEADRQETHGERDREGDERVADL